MPQSECGAGHTATKGIYNTLVTQLDKLARHNRQGSFRTKDRYYEAVKRFCAYLAVHYHLQKLENISGKHLVSYVLYLQEQGKSASTIKTDLSAIRFFHDKMSHPRYTLPDNEELGVALERRRFGQQDRTWTNPEFGKLIGRAMAEEWEDYILALYLARYAGLRIHECFRMDTAAAERALLNWTPSTSWHRPSRTLTKSPCLKAATTTATMGIPAMMAIPATGLPGAPPTTEAARIGARGILWAGTAAMRARQRI